MGVNFNHKDIIFSLKNDFPEFMTKRLKKKDPLIKEIIVKEISSPYRTGSGDDEKLWEKNNLLIGKKRFTLTFMEDASGKLSIFIGKNLIYSVKPTGRLTSKLINALSHFIKESLTE
jgi:hypothetical protein